MNFGAILYRFVLLIIIFGTLGSCQPEPEPDLPVSAIPIAEATSEPTQHLPTAAVATAAPTSTIVPSETPAAIPDDQETSSFSVLNYSDEESTTPASEPATIYTPTPDIQTLYKEKMEEGVNFAEEAEWEKAIEAFSDALTIDPESSSAYYNIGLAHQILGQLSKAIQNFDKAIELDPEEAEYYMDRGNARGDSGDVISALEDYSQAIDLDPEDARFYFNRAIIYKNQGEYDQALADYDQAILLNPDFAYAYHNRANVHRILGDLEKALADFNQGLALDPEDDLGYLNRATLHEEMGQLEQSVADLDQAISLLQPDIIGVSGSTYRTTWLDGSGSEENWIFALTMRALLNHQLGQYELALSDIDLAVLGNSTIAFEFFDSYLESNPQSNTALFGRALARELLGEADLAMADYTKAINSSGNDPMRHYYYLERGLLFARNEAYEQAIADWEQAIAIGPDNVDAYYLLGIAYRDLEDYERSLAKLVTGLESDQPSDSLDNYGYATLESDQPWDIPNSYALEIMVSADLLAASGTNQEQIEAVINAFNVVNNQIPEYEITGFQWNNLCWYATVWGLAEEVLYACELAVEMEPDHGGTHDSRGLARALIGDFTGAIEDFKYYIERGAENDVPSETIELREEWIASLEAGNNPLDDAMLERLRSE